MLYNWKFVSFTKSLRLMRIVAESRGMAMPQGLGMGMGGGGMNEAGIGQDASGRTVVRVTEEEKAALDRVKIELF
jgi:hypothetical protein